MPIGITDSTIRLSVCLGAIVGVLIGTGITLGVLRLTAWMDGRP